MLTHFHKSFLLAALATLVAVSSLVLSGCPKPPDNGEIRVTVSDEGGGGKSDALTDGDLLKLARFEKQVNWYTSITEDQANSFIRLFEARYPGVKVNLMREPTFSLVDRIRKEIDAGALQADVLHVVDPAIFVQLRSEGELLLYDPPAAVAVAPEYKDPGYWTAARLISMGMAYDAQKVSAARAPKAWSDLLNPRWKDKIGIKDAQTAGSAYAMYYFLREQYGVAYWEQLARLRPRLYKTGAALLKGLSDGEIQVAAGVMEGDIAANTKGEVQKVWPTDGVPLIPGPIGILSRAPHPDAAKLFVNFTLSTEGQTALRDLRGAYPSRGDIPPPQGWPALSSLRLLRPDNGWGEYLDKQNKLRTEYLQLFRSEGE